MADAKEFSLLRFPIHNLPKDACLLTHFKELQSYPEFTEYTEKDRNLLLRYIFYCYDMNSDLVKRFADLQKRKETAMDIAGWKRGEDGRFKNEKAYDILALVDLPSFNMIVCFLKMQNHRLWMMICSTEEAFYEYQVGIMKRVFDVKDKDTLAAIISKEKLMDNCDTMNNRIEEYYKKLFGDNTDVTDQVKKKRTTPETASVDTLARV